MYIGIQGSIVFRLSVCHLRNSMQTRFLLTCISSLLFAGERTLDELHQEIAEEAYNLFTNGVVAPTFSMASWKLGLCGYGL